MAIVPAHIMRSVGGGFDNESVAITAMCLTFYMWTRALRMPKDAAKVRDGTATKDSVIFGVLAGFAYINMAAAWGGFTFVLNLIAVHTALLTVLGRYSSRLHRAYTLFYVIGTMGAMRVPVIGWGPLRSMEQIAGLLVFIVIQVRASECASVGACICACVRACVCAQASLHAMCALVRLID